MRQEFNLHALGQVTESSPWNWDRYTWAWIIWIAWFAVWETLALLDSRNNDETLSHHLWWLRDNSASIIVFLFFGVLFWLVYHFAVEGR